MVLALQPAPDLWSHLLSYVLPFALRDTTLLLLGVGLVTLIIGAGTAWLISLHEFPGRSALLWLMPLPLAIPTYIAAYVYVDMFEPLGVVHRMLTLWLPAQNAVIALPNLRSLPGAIFIIGLVLYPYVYLSARAMFQLQSAEFSEAAKTLGLAAGILSGVSRCQWHAQPSRLDLRSLHSKPSTISAPANILAFGH